MGFRVVRVKLDLMELAVVMVEMTRAQRSGAGTLTGGFFNPHRRPVEKGRLFRSIDELYI